MTITEQLIQQTYEDCNLRFFEGKLPKPTKIGFTHNPRLMAQVVMPLYPNGNFKAIRLLFNPDLDWNKETFCKTMIHEMIHVEDTMVHRFNPDPSHGDYFRQRMRELNERFGLNLRLYIRDTQSDYHRHGLFPLIKGLWKWLWF